MVKKSFELRDFTTESSDLSNPLKKKESNGTSNHRSIYSFSSSSQSNNYNNDVTISIPMNNTRTDVIQSLETFNDDKIKVSN